MTPDEPPARTVRIAFLRNLGIDALVIDDEDLVLIDADLDPRQLHDVLHRAMGVNSVDTPET